MDIENIYDRANLFLSYIGIKLLLFLNLMRTYFEINYNSLYKSNNTFHRTIDMLNNGFYSLNKFAYPYYIDPPYSYFKICYNDDRYREVYLNSDSLLYNTVTKDVIGVLINMYKDFFTLMKPFIRKNNVDYLALLHFKNITDDFIISRVIDSKTIENHKHDNICNPLPTRNFFLSIEYKHPYMNKIIPITIDTKYLMSGNELFSPCFILKCLNYQSEPYIFDTDYSIIILDSELKNITLKHNQYIRLFDKKYEIKELELDTSDAN